MKVPRRPKMNAPGGVNNTMILAKASAAKPCSLCCEKPKVSCFNEANKPTVSRMFNYTLKCKCGRQVTHSSIEECVRLWNLRYGIPYKEENTSGFVSDDDKNNYFN